MKKEILLFAFTALSFFAFHSSASAQVEVLQDNMGRPVNQRQYVNVKGTPYLMDEWVVGSAKFNNGTVFEGIQLKYDQIADVVMFLDKSGNEQLFVEPVLEFKIGEKVFRRGYPSVDGSTPMAFYEVLYDGETQLLKRTTKKIYEEDSYSSATRVKSIVESHAYYISKSGNQLTKVKKDKKSIITALNDQNAELESYIKTNRPDLKQDADLVKLVRYYNTLK